MLLFKGVFLQSNKHRELEILKRLPLMLKIAAKLIEVAFIP